jgi:hypothetical protein
MKEIKQNWSLAMTMAIEAKHSTVTESSLFFLDTVYCVGFSFSIQ